MSEFKHNLKQTRKKLLDLSRRNKLIHYRRTTRKNYLHIIDESPELIYHDLVVKSKYLKFKSIPQPDITLMYRKLTNELKQLEKKAYPNLKGQFEYILSKIVFSDEAFFIDWIIAPPQTELNHRLIHFAQKMNNLLKKICLLQDKIEELDKERTLPIEKRAQTLGFNISSEMPEVKLIDADVVPKQYSDAFLQTLHYPNDLERILRHNTQRAKGIMEETGSNMLYLVLGLLEWYEADKPNKKIRSPLIALSVDLKKVGLNPKNRTFDYTLSYSGSPIETNYSLKEKLKQEFNMDLPLLDEQTGFNAYVEQVKKLCEERSNWKIRQEMTLDFLQFGKILMYQDLDPRNWTRYPLEKQEVLQELFVGEKENAFSYASEEYTIDSHSVAKHLPLILDADSSQQSAMVDVLRGKNVVIEGPPGTGKSQTIVNMIAALLSEGKTVLFVSEKLVALEVVFQRLEQVGLGDFCLELHSHKTKKRELLDDFKQRIDAVYPEAFEYRNQQYRLAQQKEKLQSYLEILHHPFGETEKTLFDILWLLEEHYAYAEYFEFFISNSKKLNEYTLLQCVKSLKRYQSFHTEYAMSEFFWQGLRAYKLSFTDVEAVIKLLEETKKDYIFLEKILKTLPFQIENEYDEVEKIVSFTQSFEPIDKVYFPLEQRNTFKKLETKLHAYLLAYRHFLDASEYETYSTLEILESTKRSFSLLSQFSNFETELKHDISLYKEFIARTEVQYLEFSEIEKRTKKYLYLPAVQQKTSDELLWIAKTINEKKDSWFRFFSSSYREAKREWIHLLADALPDAPEEWLERLRDLNLYTLNRENQFKLRFLLKNKMATFIGKIAKIQGEISTTLHMYDKIYLSTMNSLLKNYLASDLDNLSFFQSITEGHSQLKRTQERLKNYAEIEHEFYGVSPINICTCIEKLNQIEKHKERLSLWGEFQKEAETLRQLGLGAMVEALDKKEIPLDAVVGNFYFNFYNSLVQEALKEQDLLNYFNRVNHEKNIENFRALDVELLNLNKEHIAHKCSQRALPSSEGKGRVGTFTNLKLLRHEISKKTRHIPIRELIRRSGEAMTSLKPCFMMSPLSVAQYLPRNSMHFDVLLIDEASQMRPEEALGVMARVKQVVVVGDPKQLPPSNFFDSIKENIYEKRNIIDESESILDSCMELFRPIRRLKWHYRSQHESLIGFSNKHFYENDLTIFPSPSSLSNAELGVAYTYIEEGQYRGGDGFRVNSIEAEKLVEAIIKQIETFPEKSLGVGTFNTSQRDLILSMLNELEKENPSIANYLEQWENCHEPFFVKNLESLQGDERDVIFISTTYGKEKGKDRVMQRFGPINQENGWRRLNVLITRAKQKMHIFTSLLASDIYVKEHSSKGLIAFHSFLNFVERGELLKKRKIRSDKAKTSFQQSLYAVLQERGYQVVTHVGISGYFLDLAIVDPKTNDYVLAIECDGIAYHASKSASDRDRLKAAVLKRLGWNVYRVWSIAWYKNRGDEILNLCKVIDEILKEA